MATQKFSNFDFFMHANMRAVTIQSNKIVSNGVKDNQELLESSYRKKPYELSGQPSKDGIERTINEKVATHSFYHCSLERANRHHLEN